MNPIAIFYHCLLYLETATNRLASAQSVVSDQATQLYSCGLVSDCGIAGAASEIVVGVNGGEESREIVGWFPRQSRVVFHGLESRSENLTLVEIEKWLPSHPGWNVLYFHAKGSTNPTGHNGFVVPWRNCMMRHLINNWRTCVSDLESGYDSAGCHWMSGPGMPPGQSIWAGNFWWATSDFLATLPSIYLRDRIKVSGIASLASRYEAEVWIGNGPRLPKVKDYHASGFPNCP